MFTTARSLFITLAAVVTTGVAFPSLTAQAQAADPRTPHVVVSYADLDLASDAGVRVLYRRLKVAAQRVCGVDGDHMIIRRMEHRACYDQVLSEAVARANLEMLSVLHKNASARPRVS